MLTQAKLKQRLVYDPDTGVFIDRSGRERGTNVKGYLATRVGKQKFYLHRLAWLYMTGSWPERHLDHINGNKQDNRWENLRQATPRQNSLNSHPRPSKSGYRGVEFIGRSYRARIRIPAPKGQRKYLELGRYPTAEAAHAAYVEADIRLNGKWRRD